jgi:drug/metabolite transporter (DMT)-like permease
MPRGLAFILLAATAGGLWSALMNRASREVEPLLAPLVAEATGVLIALILLSGRLREGGLQVTQRGLGLLLAAGVCVFSVDYFTARGYALKLPVSVGAPVFLAVAILVATVVGLAFGESMSPRKGLGLLLIAAGAAMLASVAE